jgi:gamma-glutamyltranspeptidase/glutathione hydrolase
MDRQSRLAMVRRAGLRVATIASIGFLGVCAATAGEASTTAGRSAQAQKGMVVTVSRPATEVGVDILKRGGNAVDASVAVAFALAVTWPEAGNIGGGGFMLVHPGGSAEPTVIDYREMAPAAATANMFQGGKASDYRLVGVPGTVRGLERAHKKYGKRPWRDLIAPAVRLADEGLTVNAALAASLNGALKKTGGNDEFRRMFGQKGGEPWRAGDRLVQKDLAQTLRAIADGGADAFYSGRLAELFEAEMKRADGLITKDDLKSYQAKERQPVRGEYRGYTIYGPPPPSSGGTCLIEMLNIVGRFDLRKEGCTSPKTVHIMTEAMRHAYHDRARYLGDPDFTKVPDHLLAKEYAAGIADKIDLSRAGKSDDLGKEILAEGEQTTHFSVIDAAGMAVANTYTLEQSFGARIVVKGAGFLLNNEMGDFNPKPGVTDRRGRIGTPPNLVAPGKRMLSSMTPVIVTKNNRAVLITGSPGGRTIINTIFCVLLNTLEFEMPLRDAVDAPRFHHAWMPDKLTMEKDWHAVPDLVKGLREMGHAIDDAPSRQGDAHSIQVDPSSGRIHGVADRRRDGWAAGF